MIKDGSAPKKSTPIKVPKTIALSKLLLGRDNYNESHKKHDNNNWTSIIFGTHFQRKLRVHKHKNEAEVYACPRCNPGDVISSKGIITSNPEKQAEFEQELANIALYAITEYANKNLINAGLAPKGQSTVGKKGQTLSAATGIFNEMFKSNLAMRHVVKSHSKNLKKYSKELLVEPDAIGQYTTQFIDNVNTVYKGLFSTCPVCLGNGYLDIGHKDIAGKQVAMLEILYKQYIAGRQSPNWEQRINVSKLYEDIFRHLAVGPEIPKRMDKGSIKTPAVLQILAKLKVNRLDAYTKQAADAIRRTQNYMYELYKGNTKADLGTGFTYAQVIEFFGLLAGKSRVDTGTLRRKLLDQKRDYANASSSLGSYTQMFPSRHLVVEGATDAERPVKITKSSSLYVYAAAYKTSWTSEDGPDVEDIASGVFGSAPIKIEFFPQRYKNYG